MSGKGKRIWGRERVRERETQGRYEDSGCSNGRIDIGKDKGGRQEIAERNRRGMKLAGETF